MPKPKIGPFLNALDSRDMDFWDRLSPEDRNAVPLFVLNRFMSFSSGNGDMQSYYLLATNQRSNRNFFSLGKHPKLQWMLLCSSSPGMGSRRHTWIPWKTGGGKKEPDGFDTLARAYPTMKKDDLRVLAKITSPETIAAIRKANS